MDSAAEEEEEKAGGRNDGNDIEEGTLGDDN